ncbi:MAG TPA: hypothetical protein VK629_11980 [Steroidobacteraceae bacterium]|nr:hypothetical protein [Steroidobacteraceae bacterium]
MANPTKVAMGEAEALMKNIAVAVSRADEQGDTNLAGTLRQSSALIERLSSLLKPNGVRDPDSGDVQPMTRHDFPEVLEQVLDDANQRIWQAQAILKLVTGLLDASPEPDATEINRIMLAVENVVETLEPVPGWIGCNQALANECNTKISESMEEEADA